VVAEFDAAFRKTREAYLDALEAAFGARLIGSREINSARFRSFRSEFQAANPLFPVNLVLAQTWAKGYDGEPARERLAQALRASLGPALIGQFRPASTVFVANLAPADRIRSWSEAAAHARAVNRSEILSVEEAGQNLRQSLDVLDRGAGGFMSGLLRPTVIEDQYLTGLLLRERLGDQAAARVYPRGGVIVRAGEAIDRPAALALAHIARLGLEPAVPAPVTASPPAEPSVPGTVSPAPETHRTPGLPRWLGPAAWAGGAVVLLAATGLLWRARHRARRDAAWLEKAPEPATGSWRDALIPHLARELKNRLVQALFTQRQVLLHNEAAASARVAELEARLAKLQPAIAEKIRAYEKRIQELEAEIEEKDQETRDLLRAKLILARKELDAELTRHHVDWN
jgi:hypothetical protein